MSLQQKPDFKINVKWLRILVSHILITVLSLLTLIFMTVAGNVELRTAITVGLGIFILFIAHAFAFALPLLRQAFAEMEASIQASTDKAKHKDYHETARLSLSDDGELFELDESHELDAERDASSVSSKAEK